MAESQHRKKLIKLLENNCSKRNMYEVFNDFVMFGALTVSNAMDKKRYDEREKYYLEQAKRYDKDEIKTFAHALAELVGELEEHAKERQLVDVLGQTFHQLELHNKYKGQFFTPQSISDMLGALSYNQELNRRHVKKYGYITVNEPACGSGANILGFANACLRDNTFSISDNMLVIAQDIDIRCVYMCYLQMSFYGIPACVIQANTLTNKEFSRWYTPIYILNWHRWQIGERLKLMGCALELEEPAELEAPDEDMEEFLSEIF